MSAAVRLQQRVIRASTRLPMPVLRAIAGGDVVVNGELLDPQLAAILAIANRVGPRIETMEVERARRVAAQGMAPFDADLVPMARIFEEVAPGAGGDVPVRVYVPASASGGLLVYFHGGGAVIGSIEGHDRFCRLFAELAGCAVASVDYRLAPEHRFPAAVDDAVAVWPWIFTRAHRWGVDAARVAVGGDSFGGYLAAWVELASRDRAHDGRLRSGVMPRPRAQVLIYPVTDLTHASPSIDRYAEGFLLTRPMILWFRRHHIHESMWRAASPLHLADLGTAAPTLLVAAAFDPIRDDGVAYAERLRATGTPVDYRLHTSLIHGFITMTGACTAARDAVADTARATAALLRKA
ncbi:MAG: alpha/beta hydrolase [Deltaproteobacteria bacterium]|nr:alpha/beta hydrolase [Kofleriaceae bacterium]